MKKMPRIENFEDWFRGKVEYDSNLQALYSDIAELTLVAALYDKRYSNGARIDYSALRPIEECTRNILDDALSYFKNRPLNLGINLNRYIDEGLDFNFERNLTRRGLVEDVLIAENRSSDFWTEDHLKGIFHIARRLRNNLCHGKKQITLEQEANIVFAKRIYMIFTDFQLF